MRFYRAPGGSGHPAIPMVCNWIVTEAMPWTRVVRAEEFHEQTIWAVAALAVPITIVRGGVSIVKHKCGCG